MVKKKIILDTNVLISAFGWKGKPELIFQKAINKELELFISDKQLEEIIRVLDYPKFNFNADQKSKFINILLEVATLIKIDKIKNIIKEDPDDDIILTSAIIGNVDFIISGDDHLLNLKEFNGIKILNANNFIKLI